MGGDGIKGATVGTLTALLFSSVKPHIERASNSIATSVFETLKNSEEKKK